MLLLLHYGGRMEGKNMVRSLVAKRVKELTKRVQSADVRINVESDCARAATSPNVRAVHVGHMTPSHIL